MQQLYNNFGYKKIYIIWNLAKETMFSYKDYAYMTFKILLICAIIDL